MKWTLSLLLIFTWNILFAQCSDEDTVRSNAVSLLTYNSARINGSTTHFSGFVTALALRYVRVGHTDTTTASQSGSSALRNLTGLSAATQYYYYYVTTCGSSTIRQKGPYLFTTLAATIIYTPMDAAGYQFKYGKFDTGFIVPRQDTGLNRSPNIGGQIKFRPSDSLFYGYNGRIWKPLAIDSAGIITLLNLKVDSVTVSSDSLFWWCCGGVSHGYILPALANVWKLNGNTNGAVKSLGTLDAYNLKFITNNVQSGLIDLSTNSAGFGYGVLAVNTGAGNAALGYGVLNSNSSGINNTGIGNAALAVNNTGNYNTGVGTFSMQNTSSGSDNTGVGWQTLKANTTGSDNVSIGWNNLAANTTGSSNISLGSYSGLYNTTASNQYFLNNQNRSNYTGDTTKSLVYGTFNATAASQRFKINGRLEINDGTQASGYVFVGDANGIGHWAAPGGIVGATPTLQQVTDVGNSITDNFINFKGSTIPDAPLAGVGISSSGNGLLDFTQPNGHSATNNLLSLSANRTYTWPNASGTIAVSASGNAALSATGNITITGTIPIANGGTNNSSLSVTAGTIYYGDGSKLVGLAPGTTAQHLRGGNPPAWVDTAVVSSGGITIGTTTITSGTNTRILYNNSGVAGEYTLTGTGTVVAMQNTPTLTTPVFTTSAQVPLLIGGTAANDDITIEGTSHGTKTTSYVNMQTTGGLVGIGTTTPVKALNVVGGDIQIGASLTTGNLNPANYRSFIIGTDLTSAAVQLGGGGSGVFWGGLYANVGQLAIYTNNLPITFENSAERARFAQTTGNFLVGTSTDVPSAIIAMASTSKGLLIPRWTNAQMAAISSPATGLSGYNTDAKASYEYNGASYQSTGIVSGSYNSGAVVAQSTFTVTFGGTQPNATYHVNVAATSLIGAAVFYVNNKTTTTFDVVYLSGLTGTLTFDYQIAQ